jgi:hypothetical protein
MERRVLAANESMTSSTVTSTTTLRPVPADGPDEVFLQAGEIGIGHAPWIEAIR